MSIKSNLINVLNSIANKKKFTFDLDNPLDREDDTRGVDDDHPETPQTCFKNCMCQWFKTKDPNCSQKKCGLNGFGEGGPGDGSTGACCGPVGCQSPVSLGDCRGQYWPNMTCDMDVDCGETPHGPPTDIRDAPCYCRKKWNTILGFEDSEDAPCTCRGLSGAAEKTCRCRLMLQYHIGYKVSSDEEIECCKALADAVHHNCRINKTCYNRPHYNCSKQKKCVMCQCAFWSDMNKCYAQHLKSCAMQKYEDCAYCNDSPTGGSLCQPVYEGSSCPGFSEYQACYQEAKSKYQACRNNSCEGGDGDGPSQGKPHDFTIPK